MSLEVDCPACVQGNHAGHVQDWHILPGLIGGEWCGCRGDCAERAANAFDAWLATFPEGSQAFRSTPKSSPEGEG